MNLSKVKRLYRKARRTMYAQAPDMRAITSLCTVCKNTTNHKPIRAVTHELFGQITFHMGAGHPINIHAEPASMSRLDKAANYTAKLRKLSDCLGDALRHLQSKDENVFVRQEFLNDGVSNDYGSTLYIHIPKSSPALPFCVFEISSCHFKVRMTPERKELKKQLKFFIKNLDQHILDYQEGIQVLREVK